MVRNQAIHPIIFLLLSILMMLPFQAISSESDIAEGEKYNPTPLIMHHIADANEFHVFGDFSIPLPVIVYNLDKKKLDVCMSSAFEHGKKEVNGYMMDHSKVKTADGSRFIDFSITKNVFTILLAAALMLFIFLTIAKAYKTRVGKAPKGLQSFFEPLIIFVRDEIVEANIKNKPERFMPYLMTVFFFIWILNMIGLVPFFPGSANVTGNINVTFALAFFTLVITTIYANKAYWKHMLMPDTPKLLWLIMVPVELAGILIKPIALMIRLFANITAGHIMVLSLVSMIFVLGNAGQSMGGSAAGAAIAVPFVLFISLIELLVAFLQAFIFTILSAVFIGMAVEEAHH